LPVGALAVDVVDKIGANETCATSNEYFHMSLSIPVLRSYEGGNFGD
jgi:hypothetical protein